MRPALLTRTALACLCLGTLLGLAACGEASLLAPQDSIGADPKLPPPVKSFVPTVNVAKAIGWPEGVTPTPADDLRLSAFARGLEHPRWVYVLPNGDVLVAESNAPPKPDDGKGIKGFFMKLFMKSAGAGTPSANRITLLRDADGDGVAETRSVFLQGLNSPIGMALVGSNLYVAATDAVLRFPYVTGQTRISEPGTRIVELPGGAINHHWTKTLVASQDGARLYAGVGSNSNVAENGMAAEEGRAAIWEIDLRTLSHRVFASGLRNPVGMGWEPGKNVLWAVVNERDELGSDLVPDYLSSVRDGGFYGWPYSYFGDHVDDRVTPQRPDLVASAIKPDYALGTHVAPLGLAFSNGAGLPARYARGAFVGEHGSWNRRPRSGYKVVFVPFGDGGPNALPLDVLSGFISPAGEAYGRPVGVALDSKGGLFVADDVGNTVWKLSAPATRP
jgi:glucose/arabinose dehydrogenase